MRPLKFGIGQPVRRIEDIRFVTGAGRYTDDIEPDGCLRGFVVRSPHAHARFAIGGLEAAHDLPGVHAILTHADVTHLGPLPCAAPVRNRDGSRMVMPPYPVLARDIVRHVGDAIAFVVADTLDQARDAAEALEIAWEPMPATISIVGAEAESAGRVWDNVPGNVAFDIEIGEIGAVEKAFAAADRVIGLTLVNNRLVTNYLEPRACLAEHDRDSGHWTITLGSQGSHGIRDTLAKSILRVKREQIRVITPDVGGGFGTKMFMFREYPLCAVAAEHLHRPVKWTADRSEHFVADAQGRDNLNHLEMALDADGRFLALRVDLKADMGAYLSGYAPYIPTEGVRMSPGLYCIPTVYARVRGYYTHTLPVDAYRGAGRPEAAYAIERLVDHIARRIGMAPDELRARNFVRPDQMPHTTATGRVYDSGEFERHMRQAMAVADWEGFAARAETSRRRGRLRGIGIGSYIEACAGGSSEPAVVRLDADGGFTVLIGTQSSGQGHETAYAQLVAEHLDVPPERVRVRQGDTDDLRSGGGTGGSRSVPVGGVAVAFASRRLVEQLREIAAGRLEVGGADLEIAEGGFRVVGTDRSVTYAQIAAAGATTPDRLAAIDSWTPPEATYPNGTHVAEVEIDPDLGHVDVVGYTIVDDFGVTMNPLLLAGQVHGGAVQGIGQALHEHTVYDSDGQLVTASFMDYRLPRAEDVPDIRFETRNVPSSTNALGMKGAGEAGAIGSCPAVMNAVVDALHRAYGIAHLDMPATPARVAEAIREAKRSLPGGEGGLAREREPGGDNPAG